MVCQLCVFNLCTQLRVLKLRVLEFVCQTLSTKTLCTRGLNVMWIQCDVHYFVMHSMWRVFYVTYIKGDVHSTRRTLCMSSWETFLPYTLFFCPATPWNYSLKNPKWAKTLRWGWVFLEQTRILSGIQFTTHFINKFDVETKLFVGSFVHVILTQETCDQRLSAWVRMRKVNAER